MSSLAKILILVLMIFAQASFGEFQKVRLGVWGGAKDDPRDINPDKSPYSIPLTDTSFECHARAWENPMLKGILALQIACTSQKLGLDISSDGTCVAGNDNATTLVNKAAMAKIKFVEKNKTERVIWLGCSSKPLIKHD